MKRINELHNTYFNKEIWIAGSGPSLSTYPDDFFENKIGITLHMAYLKFPTTTFMYANEPDRVKYLKKAYPSFYKVKHIYGIPFHGISKRESYELISDLSNVYSFWRRPYPPKGIRGKIDWTFTYKKVKQARAGKGTVFGGHGTCLHGALYAAIMLGGNPINLIGTGHGMYKGNEHFSAVLEIDKGMRPNAPSFSDPNNNVPMIEQTLAIINACRSIGVSVNWIKDYSKTEAYEKYQIKRENLEKMKLQYTRKFTVNKKIKNSIKQLYNPMINSL